MVRNKSATPSPKKSSTKKVSDVVSSPKKAMSERTAEGSSKVAKKIAEKPSDSITKVSATPKAATAKKKTSSTLSKNETGVVKEVEKSGKIVNKVAAAVGVSPFFEKQRIRLLELKDTLLDSMSGVARDSLRSGSEGDSSAFGMHQADAGTDTYDRDFALSMLSQEQDALYEIAEALKRLEEGSYGVCEMSGKPIPKARLEALPCTRYTVECQSEIEKRTRYQKWNRPSTSLFGLTEEDEEEEDVGDNKD